MYLLIIEQNGSHCVSAILFSLSVCFVYLFLFLCYLNDFHNLECNQKGVYAILGYDNLCVDKTVQIKKRLSKCS